MVPLRGKKERVKTRIFMKKLWWLWWFRWGGKRNRSRPEFLWKGEEKRGRKSGYFLMRGKEGSGQGQGKRIRIVMIKKKEEGSRLWWSTNILIRIRIGLWRTCSGGVGHIVVDILQTDGVVGRQGRYGKDHNGPARISIGCWWWDRVEGKNISLWQWLFHDEII